VFVTTHVLAGAVIGRALARHPVGAFCAGVISHFAMDACPHWGVDRDLAGSEERFLRAARCDGCAGLAAMAVAAGTAPGSTRKAVLAGMIGGALPDADKPFEHFFGVNPFPVPVQRFHSWIQRESPDRLPHELVLAAAGALAAWLALRA
jgi:hypothetical protein